MAKRRRRRRSSSKRIRPSLILIVALAVLVAGFLTRRVLAPRAMYFLTHRSAASPPRVAGEPVSARPRVDGTGENLTDSDRHTLDQVIREKGGR